MSAEITTIKSISATRAKAFNEGNAKGIAIYPEVGSRAVSLPLPPEVAAKMRGDIVLSYYEAAEAGGGLIAQVRTVLP